jgi:hypothetical protein
MIGTIVVRNGLTVLTSGSDYTIDYATGIIATGVAAASLNWSGRFFVPARYDVQELNVRARATDRKSGEVYVDVQSILIVEVRE